MLANKHVSNYIRLDKSAIFLKLEETIKNIMLVCKKNKSKC